MSHSTSEFLEFVTYPQSAVLLEYSAAIKLYSDRAADERVPPTMRSRRRGEVLGNEIDHLEI